MNIERIKTFETRLKIRLTELEDRLQHIEEDLDAPKPKDWEEAATEGEGDEVLEDLGKAGLLEIKMIQAALHRIDDGSYGVCAQCGDDISEERLTALPHTPLCVKCAR